MYCKKFCTDIESVENYEKAKKDNFIGWELHHRLETHNSDGERRVVAISRKELIALDMYLNRPAEELIFLTVSEHRSLHFKGNQHNVGKHHSKETKRKRSEALKGHHTSEETRRKISAKSKGNQKAKGKHWYNNGKISTRAKICPTGFVPGRLK